MSRVVNLQVSNNTATGLAMSFYAGEDGVIYCQMQPVQDITGWHIQFLVRAQLNILPILITKTVSAGITITNAPNGMFSITMDSADTVSATPGSYFFDIQRTDTGFRSELGIGNLTILQPVAAM